MGFTPNVADKALIEPAWGNEIRDRTRQVFDTEGQRDSEWPAPPNGAECVTLDTGTTWSHLAGTWVATSHSVATTSAAEVPIYSGGSAATMPNVTIPAAGNYLCIGTAGVINRATSGFGQIVLQLYINNVTLGAQVEAWLMAPGEQVTLPFVAVASLPAGSVPVSINGALNGGQAMAVSRRQVQLVRLP